MSHLRSVLLILLVFQSGPALAQDDPQDAAPAAYDAFEDAYLNNEWDRIDELHRALRPHMPKLTPPQKKNITYARRTMREYQPKWWNGVKSPSSVTFPAEIWNKRFAANYVPSQALGVQAVQAEGTTRLSRSGKIKSRITGLKVLVSWKPHMVDSADPATGKLAEIHGTALGDLAEVIVWHELGHNYVTIALPLEHVIELYENYSLLFYHLQEFYADLTALHHASPRARRVTLMMRLAGLDHYREDEQHDRAAHGIGALLLAKMLANPDNWPSVRFPPAVPKQQVELNTIIYVYEHWSPDWSIAEARALRDFAGDFIKRQGDRTLRRKGVFDLPNKLKFSLMRTGDGEHQAKRDAWVARRLEALIADGRADVLEEGQTYDPPRRKMPSDGAVIISDPDKLRIDIPH